MCDLYCKLIKTIKQQPKYFIFISTSKSANNHVAPCNNTFYTLFSSFPNMNMSGFISKIYLSLVSSRYTSTHICCSDKSNVFTGILRTFNDQRGVLRDPQFHEGAALFPGFVGQDRSAGVGQRLSVQNDAFAETSRPARQSETPGRSSPPGLT